jgi:hypothetical protein
VKRRKFLDDNFKNGGSAIKNYQADAYGGNGRKVDRFGVG